jgi:hypothetical protein
MSLKPTWIYDLNGDSSHQQTASSITNLLNGLTDSLAADHVRKKTDWWRLIRLTDEIQPVDLVDRDPIDSPEDGNLFLPFDNEIGYVVLLGSLDEESRVPMRRFLDFAKKLREEDPADRLGGPGSLFRLGIVRVPERVLRQQDQRAEIAGYLTMLHHTMEEPRCFDALVLVADTVTSPDRAGDITIAVEDRGAQVAQIIQHFVALGGSPQTLPKGICSAGAFCLHSHWANFQKHCSWLAAGDLWKKFLEEDRPPFADVNALQGRENGFRQAASGWGPRLVSAVQTLDEQFPGRIPDVTLTHEPSPWKFWDSRLLDVGNFYHTFIRNHLQRLNHELSIKFESTVTASHQRATQEASELTRNTRIALRDAFNQICGREQIPRSKRHFEAFLEQTRAIVEREEKNIRAEATPFFSFPQEEKNLNAMLDAARKEVEAGNSERAEASEYLGLLNRLKSFPILLGMIARALLLGVMIAFLVPPFVGYLTHEHPDSPLTTIPPAIWSLLAFAGPFLIMLFSLVLRKNHIVQHGRILTALAHARIEHEIHEQIRTIWHDAFAVVKGSVHRALSEFQEFCGELQQQFEPSHAPPISHSYMPRTAFQRPLMGNEACLSGKDMPGPREAFRLKNRDKLVRDHLSLQDADWIHHLQQMIRFDGYEEPKGFVRPQDMVVSFLPESYPEDWKHSEKAATAKCLAERALVHTQLFCLDKPGIIEFTDPEHQQFWQDSSRGYEPYGPEIVIRSQPSVERNQGFDTKENDYGKCSKDVIHATQLDGFEDSIELKGLTSWMKAYEFTKLFHAIPQQRMIQDACAWLMNRLSASAKSQIPVESTHAGIVQIEREPDTIVQKDEVLMKIGNQEIKAPELGLFRVRADQEIHGMEVNVSQPLARIITLHQAPDPLLLSIIRNKGANACRTAMNGERIGVDEDVLRYYKALAESAQH